MPSLRRNESCSTNRNHGQCERHDIAEERGVEEKDDEVDHGVSIIEDKWKPKVIEEKGRGAVQ